MEANLEAGRIYVELKPYFPYRTWLPFLKAEAEVVGLNYRTIQSYMKLARETDNPQKYAKSAYCKAEDPNSIARKLGDAIAEKEAEEAKAAAAKHAQHEPGQSGRAAPDRVNVSAENPIDGESSEEQQQGESEEEVQSDSDADPNERADTPFIPMVLTQIPVSIPANWQDGISKLIGSQNWKVAEMEFRALLRRLLVWFKYIEEPSPVPGNEEKGIPDLWSDSERPNHGTDMA
jgi:hypothetical protein